jgi:hypothetical protein
MIALLLDIYILIDYEAVRKSTHNQHIFSNQ